MALKEDDRLKLDSIVSKMVANGESDDDIQFVVNDFKSIYDKGDDIAKSTMPEEEPQTEPSKAEGIAESLFPRTVKAGIAEKERTGGKPTIGSFFKEGLPSAGLDALSLAGRTVASIPALMPGGEKFSDAIKRTESDKSGVAGFIGDVVRDPATMAGVLTGGAASGALKGAGIIGKAGAPLIQKIGAGAAIGAAEGAGSGVTRGIENVMEGEQTVGEAAKSAAIETGASATMGGIFPAMQKFAGDAFQSVGKKIQMSGIRPQSKAIKQGFDIDNVFKHNLDGTLQESAEKLDLKFNDLGAQLRNELTKTDAQVDLSDALINAKEYLAGSREKLAEQGGKIADIDKAVEKFLGDVEALTPDGKVDLLTANKYKRAIGKMGAWNIKDPNAQLEAQKEVANAFYRAMNESIMDAADNSDNLRRINKELSEIIPIERAIIERIPVAARQDLFSLSDIVSTAGAIASMDPKAWGLVVANKLTKFPKTGSKLYRAGEVMINDPLKSKTAAAARLGAREFGTPALNDLLNGLSEDQIKEMSKARGDK
jgi:hypothetical protein